MHQTAQFSSGVLVRASAVLGPVAAAACFHSQLEMFLPPRPAVRACWLKGRCSHQMLQDTANIFLFFFLSFFPPPPPRLLPSKPSRNPSAVRAARWVRARPGHHGSLRSAPLRPFPKSYYLRNSSLTDWGSASATACPAPEAPPGGV